MILEMPEEWDRQRESKTEPRGELVKIELNGPKKTSLVRIELIDLEKVKVTELLRVVYPTLLGF